LEFYNQTDEIFSLDDVMNEINSCNETTFVKDLPENLKLLACNQSLAGKSLEIFL
jgi:hypothetical protein